jgi:predicted transposase YbfD/YdcC
MFALQGSIITIDAMGCQYARAEHIVGAKADYLFSLKGNQGTMHDDVVEYCAAIDFKNPEAGVKVVTTHEVEHGRIEQRIHAVTGDVGWHPLWKSIKSIAGKRGNAGQ